MQEDTGETRPPPQLDEKLLVADLKRALQTTIFTNRLQVSPRQLNQIAGEFAASFLRFLAEEDEASVHAYGHSLAQSGFSHRTILTVTETSRRVCWESASPALELLPVTGRYVVALLEGYMLGREAYLLEEQERSWKALNRAREQDISE
jgi:hypothetical protein